jgi:type I restriction enzyme S subunit
MRLGGLVMALTKYKLGTLLELSENRNTDLQYGIDDVKGISIQKMFIETKADMSGVSLRPYYLVEPDDFAYVTVTSRNGEKITLAHNDTKSTYIVSSSYVVFRVKRTDLLLSEYLFMYFNRPEFDRYARFNSWGSARETFSWNEMCDVEIELPSIEVQKKYTNIYLSILSNQRSYEHGLEDLKLVCEAEIDKIKHTATKIALGELVQDEDERNSNGAITSVHGVNKDKLFMPSVASGADLTKYKVVSKNQFACNLMHVGRDKAVPVALQNSENNIIVSPAYFVFSISDEKVLPEYVLMWLSRGETDRYAWFMSDTNVRSGMERKRFLEIGIPVPSETVQHSLVELHNALSIRREINERLKTQIKDLCPILIKGSIAEAARI